MAYAYKRVDTPTELEITEEAFFSEKSLLSSVDRLEVMAETRERAKGIYQMESGVFFDSLGHAVCYVDLALGEEFHGEQEIRQHLSAYYNIKPDKILIEIDPNHR